MSAEIATLAPQPLIVGSGVAGMLLALSLAPHPVTLLTKASLAGASSTTLAQGGIAAALGKDDGIELHLADTLAAGDGLVDAEAARAILQRTEQVVEALIHFGTRFDKNGDGSLQRGLEAAHSRNRILHAEGDATGAEIARALATAIRQTPSISCLEGFEGRRILCEDGRVYGLLCDKNGQAVVLPSTQIIMATGGIGGLYAHSTNPSGNFGAGLAMAARAGVRLVDMEFVQFHPTALDCAIRPLPLLSEAIRGEGAVLRNSSGRRLMEAIPGGDLAPRDVVARAIAAELHKNDTVWLDATVSPGPAFSTRFPAIFDMLQKKGIDPASAQIPVRPAVHYHMGGIATDPAGRTSIEGLWAIGESACTGLHGANRLASNSLLEAGAMAITAAEAIKGTPQRRKTISQKALLPPASHPELVRKTVSDYLGILRNRQGLTLAIDQLMPCALSNGPESDPALVGLMIAYAALSREESRGAHMRSDGVQKRSPKRHFFTLSDLFEALGRSPAHQIRGL